MEITATSSSNGWHRTTSGRYEVTWRTQRPECCQHITPFDADHAPFYRDGGEIEERTRQCGGCGRVFAGRFNVRHLWARKTWA